MRQAKTPESHEQGIPAAPLRHWTSIKNPSVSEHSLGPGQLRREVPSFRDRSYDFAACLCHQVLKLWPTCSSPVRQTFGLLAAPTLLGVSLLLVVSSVAIGIVFLYGTNNCGGRKTCRTA